MSLTLAGTWNPRGDRARLQKLYPQLEQIYDAIVVAVPKSIDEEDRLLIQKQLGLSVVTMPQPGWGRYMALEEALTTGANYIHYADFDRLLHWVEIDPFELQTTVQAIQQTDCLIIGRTEQAFRTHPQAIIQTEQIINAVASNLLSQAVDLGGGSRGLSREATRFLITHTTGGNWGDAQWPILLQRAGFEVTFVAVSGLEWETPDRHQERVADRKRRSEAATSYDQGSRNWAKRVRIAQEIIQEGLAAAQTPISLLK